MMNCVASVILLPNIILISTEKYSSLYFGMSCHKCYFKCLRTSIRRKSKVTSVAKTSAIGKEYQTPFKPKNFGNRYTNGIKNIPCFSKVSIKAGKALPAA